MKVITLFILFFVFISCGNIADLSQEGSTLSTQATSISGTYIVPDPQMVGSVSHFKTSDNKTYLIGSQTSQEVATQLNNLSQGSYPLKVYGTFGKESGMFPNPTAEFDVINITGFSNYYN